MRGIRLDVDSLRTDLAAAAQRVGALEEAAERAHHKRDALILDALAAGLSAAEIAKLAQVTNQRVRMLARQGARASASPV